MKKSEFPAQKFLIHSLKKEYGIGVARLTFLPIGADMNASVYKAESSDQTSYFVKLKRGHNFNISIAITELLQSKGILQIIPQVKTIDGTSFQHLEEYTLIVYPFIEGQDGFSRTLTDKQWVELGKALRQVHEVFVPRSIQNQIRRENYSPKWRDFVRSLVMQIENEAAVNEVAVKLKNFMKAHHEDILRLVNTAEELSRKIKTTPYVLCHSDIHGGNILIHDEDSFYIVDWDDPIMAPKERDLMFIGGGVANVWNKPQEEILFYRGYGKTKVDAHLLAYYRHERIVEDIAEFGEKLLLTKTGGRDRPLFFKLFTDMFEPNGVVDIAFKSDAR